MEPTKKVMPQPSVNARELTDHEKNEKAGFKPLTESAVWSILHNVADGKDLVKACKEHNSNIGSLRIYTKKNPKIAELVRYAKKIRAERLSELVYKETIEQLQKLETMVGTDRARSFKSLYKYIERQTALEDSEQDLKRLLELEKHSLATKDVGKTLVIKASWAKQAEGYDLEGKRVDAPDKPIEDQFVKLGEGK